MNTKTTRETITRLGSFDGLFNVIEANDPSNIVNPLPIYEAAAEALANELTDITGVQYIAVAVDVPNPPKGASHA